MKSAADWVAEFKSAQRGGAGGQTLENMRPPDLFDLVRAAQIDAIKFCLDEAVKVHPFANPYTTALADKLSELEREASK